MTEATKVINPLIVDNILFIHGNEPQNAKRLKRKFTIKKINHVITAKAIHSGKFDKEAVDVLYNYLLNIKKKGTRPFATVSPESVGVLCDSNVLLNNITRLPPPPIEWDVLCCESDVVKYNYDNKHNNVYWCSTSIKDTRHFVIKWDSIDKVLPIAKKSTSWVSFVDNIQKELFVYTITQYYLSEPLHRHIHVSEETFRSKNSSLEEKQKVVRDYGSVCREELKKSLQNNTTIQQLGDKYDSIMRKTSNEMKYKMLPKVSLVCLLTSPDKFFHTLHSFLKLDYPRDKLQLIVVDDTDGEKKIKHFLPEDSRIKIVNITKALKMSKKKDQDYVKLPVGYKLNTGVKYADNDIIYHFFDTNHYFVSQFRMLIKALVVSNCDVIMAGQTAYHHDDKSEVDNVPSVANMLYNKNFWKVDAFDESYNESNIVLYNFIKHRQSCVCYAPFVYFSFEHTDTDWYTQRDHKELDFTLTDILDPLTKESYEV